MDREEYLTKCERLSRERWQPLPLSLKLPRPFRVPVELKFRSRELPGGGTGDAPSSLVCDPLGVFNWITERAHIGLIEGGPGSGKSTVLWLILGDLAREARAGASQYVPVHVSLSRRGREPAGDFLVRHLAEATGFGAPVALLVDGLDLLPMDEVDPFVELTLSRLSPNDRLVAATRPGVPMEASEPVLWERGHVRGELLDIGQDEQDALGDELARMFGPPKDRDCLAFASAEDDRGDLIGKPLFLAIVISLAFDADDIVEKYVSSLPGKAGLIGTFVNKLERRGVASHRLGPGEFQELAPRRRKFEDFCLALAEHSRTITEALLVNGEDAADVADVVELGMRTGVLVRDGAQYRFLHQQFLEFFAGCALARRFGSSVAKAPLVSIDWRTIDSAVWTSLSRADPEWDEVTCFALQIAEDQIPGLGARVYRQLTAVDPREAEWWAERLRTRSVVELLEGLVRESLESGHAGSGFRLAVRLPETIGTVRQLLADAEGERWKLWTGGFDWGPPRHAIPLLCDALARHDDDRVRTEAAWLLGYHAHDPAVVAVLTRAIGDASTAEVCSSCVRALGRYNHPEAVAALRQLISGSPDDEVRALAVRALASPVRSEVVPDIEEAFYRNPSRVVREACLCALAEMPTREAYAALVRVLQSEERPEVPEACVETSARYGEIAPGVALVEALDEDAEQAFREQLARLLQAFCDRLLEWYEDSGDTDHWPAHAWTILTRLSVEDPSPVVREVCTVALSLSLRETDQDELIRVSKECTDTEFQSTALDCYGNAHGVLSVPQLMVAIDSETEAHRREKLRAIFVRTAPAPEEAALFLAARMMRLPTEFPFFALGDFMGLHVRGAPTGRLALLWALLCHPSALHRRFAAVEVWGCGGDEVVLSLSLALEGDVNPQVRSEAAHFLGLTLSGDFAPVSDGAPDADVRVEPVSEEMKARAVQRLVAALDDGDAKVRLDAARALVELGRSEGFAAVSEARKAEATSRAHALIARLSEDDTSVRLEAARSLVGLGRNEGIGVLLDALGTESDPRKLDAMAGELAATGDVRVVDALLDRFFPERGAAQPTVNVLNALRDLAGESPKDRTIRAYLRSLTVPEGTREWEKDIHRLARERLAAVRDRERVRALILAEPDYERLLPGTRAGADLCGTRIPPPGLLEIQTMGDQGRSRDMGQCLRTPHGISASAAPPPAVPEPIAPVPEPETQLLRPGSPDTCGVPEGLGRCGRTGTTHEDALAASRRGDALQEDGRRLLRELREQEHQIIGESDALVRVFGLVARAGHHAVLLRGESGTGKEVVARALHACSPRANGRFVAHNCAVVAQHLAEAELFGHEKGAFTGADETRVGLFEMADGGTLLLDEVTELPIDVQAKLLRVLDEFAFRRVRGTADVLVDVRIICATNADVDEAVREGRFRADLLHRLNVLPIFLPPLRDRREDIPLLARHFLGLSRAPTATTRALSAGALKCLQEHDWPGNVRELRAVIERAALLASDETDEVGKDDVLRAFSVGRGGAVSSISPGSEVPMDPEVLILRFVAEHGMVTTALCVSKLGIKARTAQRITRALTVSRRLEKRGSGRNVHYVLPQT